MRSYIIFMLLVLFAELPLSSLSYADGTLSITVLDEEGNDITNLGVFWYGRKNLLKREDPTLPYDASGKVVDPAKRELWKPHGNYTNDGICRIKASIFDGCGNNLYGTFYLDEVNRFTLPPGQYLVAATLRLQFVNTDLFLGEATGTVSNPVYYPPPDGIDEKGPYEGMEILPVMSPRSGYDFQMKKLYTYNLVAYSWALVQEGKSNNALVLMCQQQKSLTHSPRPDDENGLLFEVSKDATYEGVQDQVEEGLKSFFPKLPDSGL